MVGRGEAALRPRSFVGDLRRRRRRWGELGFGGLLFGEGSGVASAALGGAWSRATAFREVALRLGLGLESGLGLGLGLGLGVTEAASAWVRILPSDSKYSTSAAGESSSLGSCSTQGIGLG